MIFIPHYRLKSLVQKLAMVASLPVDYAALHPWRALQRAALAETVEFIRAEMPGAIAFDTPRDLLAHALTLLPDAGLVAEFGVNEGGTINFIARRLPGRTIDGFDSFEGLPEDWAGAHLTRGMFSRRGRPPSVRRNVRLHPGLFDDSLPRFAAAHPGPLAFLHVDCDLYSSTASVFRHLGDRVGPGTVIVFDEYFNYPNWQAHEHRAFREFVAARRLAFDYLGYSFAQVAIRVRGD